MLFPNDKVGGSIGAALPRALERSGRARGKAAGGRSLTPGQQMPEKSLIAVGRVVKPEQPPEPRASASASSHLRGRDFSMGRDSSERVFVGVDVSKSRLDVCILPSGKT